MRRLFSVLLALALLFSFAYAEISAYDLAGKLAESIGEISDVHNAPLNNLDNRAIWDDSRANARCALVVYVDAATAEEAELTDSTRDTSVRAVDICALYLDSDMGAEAIRAYERVLMEILGVEPDAEDVHYILNVSTGKMHCPYCYSVLDMKETNKLPFSGTREEAIAQNYIPCKKCNP